ncbi:MAG: DOMON domain-containing protein [Desulfocapsaceae bacterium]|nr:DOMON domain-containing protein [Desulfocapsaceae bacterium]
MTGKVLRLGTLLFFCMVLVFSSNGYAAGYDHEITVQKMVFSWKVDGANINVKLTAPTKGWVGIGFNPSDEMKDAKFVLGYVKDGKLVLTNDFGTADTKHEAVETLGGKSDVTAIGGNIQGDMTTIEFALPLVSTDGKGCKIDPAGNTIVLLAYGPDNDSFKIKHKFRTKISVNLTTGEYK